VTLVPASSGGGTVSGVSVTGTAASGQVPVASSATAGAWGYPPGYEINYTQITANVNIVSTTEATGTTILSPGAITFDGTLVLCHFYTPRIQADTSSAGDVVIVSLFEGATQIARLGIVTTLITTTNFSSTMSAFYRFTPTAASHTYTITAYASSTTGTPIVGAGAGGTAAYSPAFVRFTKV